MYDADIFKNTCGVGDDNNDNFTIATPVSFSVQKM
jgi:hypothetical protein